MDELSLYVLDITMNSVRAGATEIAITLREDGHFSDDITADLIYQRLDRSERLSGTDNIIHDQYFSVFQ